MNHRRDEQYGRQQFGRHNEEFDDERWRDRDGNERSMMQGGRGQDDWRRDSDRSGWGRNGGDEQRFGGREGYGGDWRTEGLGGRFESQGRVGPGIRGGRESYGYEGAGGYGYGEGARGGFSYAEQGMRGETMRGGPMMGQRRWANEGLANDFSVEGTRNFSRDERRSNARGWGVGSAFENGGGVRVSHRGKGPKGFKRSDDRIREHVSEILMDHHEIDASDIEVQVKDGEVTLSGTVADRRTKRLAEEVIENLSGVNDVHNGIRVARSETTTQPSAPVAQGRSNGNPAPSSRSH